MPPDAGYIVFLFLLAFGAFYVSLYFSIFLHEVGHAVCVWLSGCRVTSFGLGTSRPLVVVCFRGVRIYFCSRRPLQGLTFWTSPQLLPSRRQQVLVLAGGALAHFLLTALAASLLWLWPAWAIAWWVFGGVNLLMGLTNLIPFRFRLGAHTLQSDGALILTVLRSGSTSSGSTQVLSTLQAFRELWQATGDLHILYVQLLAAAEHWVGLGDAGRGGELLAEARALSFEPLPAWRAYGLLTEAKIALGRDDPEGAALVLTKAEDQFRLLDHEAGLFLTRLVGEALLRQRGEVAEALRTLEVLAAHPLVRSRASLRSLLLAQRISCLCGLPDGDPETLLDEYAALPTSYRSPVADVHVFQSAARRRRRVRGERAEQAYAQALAAAGAIDARMSGADQERFRLAQGPLLAEARECLRERGREEEAAKLDAFFPTPKERARQAREARGRREARLTRQGVTLLLFNGAIIVVLLAAACLMTMFRPDADEGGREAVGAQVVWTLGHSIGFLGGSLIASLAVCSLFGALFGLPLAALGRFLKGFAGLAGKWFLLMAVVPWVLWTIVLIVVSCDWMNGGAGP